MKRILSVGILAAVGLISHAQASTNLVANGSFESSTYKVNHEFGVLFGGQGVTSWKATGPKGISFYFFGGIASTVSPINRFNDHKAMLALSYPGPSPDGGNFIGLDSDGGVGASSPLVQTISSLTSGKSYKLDYYWAATQLQNRKGKTTDYMTATFGGVTQNSGPAVLVASQGFVGWTKVTQLFHATGATDTLSFFAKGTPSGLPPFVLLDGVSLTTIPEPASWMLLIAGFGLVGVAARRRGHAVAA